MDFRLLRYFTTVAEELHFTKAAERLGITQPTLSQQIRILEDRVNAVLFHRNGKSVEITEAGYILLRQVNRVFFEVEKAITMIDELNGLQRGNLAVGCSGNRLLYTPLLQFHKQYPNIKVSVLDLKTEETVEKLLNSEIDLGVVYLPINNPRIKTIPLFSADLLAITSENHQLTKERKIYIEDLLNYPLFLMPEQYYIRRAINSYCADQGFSINATVESLDTYSLIQMALINNGVTILPKLYADFIKTDISFLRIEDPIPPLQIGIIYRKGQYMSTLIKEFITQLKSEYMPEIRKI